MMRNELMREGNVNTQQASNVGSESPTPNDISRSSDESNARGARES